MTGCSLRAWMVVTASALIWELVACGPPQPHYPPPDNPGASSSSGTTVATKKPGWVDSGRPGRYPNMQYLSGVGRGPSRMACENDARGALAKIFKAEVQQESNDWMGHFSKVNATGKVQVEAMAVSQLTRVSTDYVLKGSRVAEVWKGPGAEHCLAVLERLPASRTLRDEIDRLDVQIAAKVREGDEAANPTARFFAYKRAMELLQRRAALNTELRIVSPTGAGKKPLVGWQDLVAKFTGAASKIKIGLKITGRDSKKIQTCLAEALTKQGIRVQETSSDVDLYVRGGMKWRWAGVVRNSYMVKIDLNLRIFNVANGKTVAAFADELKTGRPQRSQSLQTAANKLCFQSAPKLANKIKSALTK